MKMNDIIILLTLTLLYIIFMLIFLYVQEKNYLNDLERKNDVLNDLLKFEQRITKKGVK